MYIPSVLFANSFVNSMRANFDVSKISFSLYSRLSQFKSVKFILAFFPLCAAPTRFTIRVGKIGDEDFSILSSSKFVKRNGPVKEIIDKLNYITSVSSQFLQRQGAKFNKKNTVIHEGFALEDRMTTERLVDLDNLLMEVK